MVKASKDENSDLFWALVGGGNNFCVITQAELYTLNISSALIGAVSWGTEVKEKYIKSVEQFALYGETHPKASFEGQTRWVPTRSPNISFDGYLWYSGEGDVPLGLENFTAPAMPFTRGNLTRTQMGTWANSINNTPPLNSRAMFHWLTSPANATALTIAFDTYYEVIAQLEDIEGLSIAFSTLPITPRVTQLPPGNPLGVSRDDAPAIWYVESPLWRREEDDERVIAVHAEANALIKERWAAAGFSALDFFYLSDIEKSQIPSVYPSYGAENLKKLKSIRNKYDPTRVFTDLVPGGAKIALS